jgi:hypothetical protein
VGADAGRARAVVSANYFSAGVRISRPVILVLLVLALRLPFLNQAIQGDDIFYLYGAEHAQVDPLHPTHTQYLFQGDLVDMRGHPHGPLNAWILAAPLAVLGEVREAPFHVLYILWSLIAVLAMWSLARRFCEQPFLATLLFLAVPAFVVNGNSLEADLPFLAMWMAAVALFVKAIDSGSRWLLGWSALFGALAGLAAYQSILLTPVLAVYLIEKRRASNLAGKVGWAAILAAPIAIAAWQLFELASSGVLPATVLIGYMRSYGFQSAANKARSAAALIVHSAWIVSPIILVFLKGPRWRPQFRWIGAGAAAVCALIYDPNLPFALSVGCGVLLLATCFRRDFVSLWILIFFVGAAIIFFAGSARYLLPIAAPVAILAARQVSRAVLVTGFALQMALSIGLAVVNYQHWDDYRSFARSLAKEASEGRVWINADWGLRWYLEQEGALAMPKDQAIQAGDVVVTSALASPLPVHAQLVPISQMEVRPALPLRIISLDRRSGYSQGGLLPFEISNGPTDQVRAEVAIERKPTLIWISPHDPEAAAQIIGGLSSDGWMSDKATVLLKRPDHALPLRVEIFIPPQAPARHVQMFVDGELAAEETYARAGSFVISVPPITAGPSLTVTLTVDQTFSTAGDRRKLGVIVVGVGFR